MPNAISTTRRLHRAATALVPWCLLAGHFFFAAPARAQQQQISLNFRNVDIQDVLKTLTAQGGLKIVTSSAVKATVTVFVDNISVMDALSLVVETQGLAYYKERGVIKVVTAEEYKQQFGKAFKNPMITRVVPLHFASAELAVKSLFQLKSKDGNVISDQRSNSLILIDYPEVVRDMETVIKEVDVPLQARAYSLNHVPAQSIEEIVKSMISAGGKVSADAKSNQLIVFDNAERLQRIEEFIRRADTSGAAEMEIFSLQYADPRSVVAKLKDEVTPGVGNVVADEGSDKIFVTELPSNMPYIRRLIAALDQRTRQVLIEAKIIQIVLNDNFKMGVDWQAMTGKFGGIDIGAAFRILADSDPGIRGHAAAISSGQGTISALIEALHNVGKTELLSNPRITCVDGQEARILVGSTIPYKTFDYREDQGVLKTFEKVTTVEVGVKLNVTPTINDDDFITMKIKPEVSEVTSFIENLPVIDKSESETTVIAKDGITIIIGGLIRDQKIVTESRVPVLGRLPLLGMLFRSHSKIKAKTELVILLRPQIVTGDVNMSAR